MKLTKILIVPIVLVLLYSCQTTEPTVSRTVEPLNGGVQSGSNPIVYALPRTVLNVEVTATKVTKKRGPYYRYAKKYLGIEEGIQADQMEWILNSVNINSYDEIDPDQYYVVNSTGNVYSNYLHLTREGLVLTSNPNIYSDNQVIHEIESIAGDEIFFTDKTVKRNLTEKPDTIYRLIESDTGFVRVPHVQLKSNLKSDDSKAEEAANFIIKIRKRRFKLLSGQYDVFPEGIALEYAIKELIQLENEYLALFVGKVIRKEEKKIFEIVPDVGTEGNRIVLFRFSAENGVLPENDLTGRPIHIKIEGLNDSGKFSKLENQNETVRSSDLVYRVPNPCNIEVIDGENLLTKKRLLISQLGTIFRLPENLYLPPK